jgi:hypothetical protein
VRIHPDDVGVIGRIASANRLLFVAL